METSRLARITIVILAIAAVFFGAMFAFEGYLNAQKDAEISALKEQVYQLSQSEKEDEAYEDDVSPSYYSGCVKTSIREYAAEYLYKSESVNESFQLSDPVILADRWALFTASYKENRASYIAYLKDDGYWEVKLKTSEIL